MNKRFLLRAHFDCCHQLISELQHQLQHADLAFCHYYQLPKIKESTHTAAQKITVKAYEGKSALAKSSAALKDHIKQPNFNGKLLTRHPAIIGLGGHCQHIIKLIDAINAEKTAFKQLVLTEKTKDARFELVHSAVPNLITLAFYRQLYYLDKPAHSVRFTWMHKHSIQHISKAKALATIHKAEPPSLSDKDTWHAFIEQEKGRILSLKDEQTLRIRRPISVSPQVNVRFSANKRYHVSAALPFILFNADQITKIGSLGNYLKKADAREKKSRYLIERLYLEAI